MMMGHWPGGSNLSASAAPFTVDRSLPKPIPSPPLHSTDPPSYASVAPLNPSLHGWANSYLPNSTPDYFPFPSHEFESPNAYTHSPSAVRVPPLEPLVSASADAPLYAQTSANLPEAKPYYTSYASPTISDDSSSVVAQQSGYDLLSASHVETTTNGFSNATLTPCSSGSENINPWGGLWEGCAGWQQAKLPHIDGSFCSSQTQGFYASNTRSKYEEPSSGIALVGGELLTEPGCTGRFDYKSFGRENPMFIPFDYSTASTLASASVVPETHPWAPTSKAVNSWDYQIPCTASYDKCSRKHDALPNASTSLVKSSSTVVIRSPGQASYLFKNCIKDGDDRGSAANNPSIVKEPHAFISSKRKALFDASQLSFHLEQNDHNFMEICSTGSGELPSNKQVSEGLLDQFFVANEEIQVPHTYLDCLSFVVDNNGATDSGENCSESLDQHNPSVDSPCWKGAPASQLSPIEFFEVVTIQDMKGLDACNDSNLRSPQILPLAPNDTATVFAEKGSKNSLQHDIGCSENNSAPSLKGPSVESVLFREENDVVKSGAHHTKPSYGQGVQISDGIHEPRKENAMSNKSINNSGFKRPEKNYTFGIGISDVATNDDPHDCSSHVPFHAIEHVLSSSPSLEDAPDKLINAHGEKSIPRMHAQTLLNAMHNLSELLLVRCSNIECELNEEECVVLKGVINNLNACVFKNSERMASVHESSIPREDPSQFIGKPSKLHKGTTVEMTQISRDHAVNYQSQHVEGKKDYDKIDERLSNFVSVRGATDGKRDDNMTQAIKKVLSENFPFEEETQPLLLLYKNLWLEAEASLCSINYVSRFNRIKTELEKLKLREANVFPENTKGIKDISSSRVSSDIFTDSEPIVYEKGGAAPCISCPVSSTLGTSSHADDVLARFHILKCRVDQSNSVDSSVEKLSGSKVSPDVSKVDKLAHELKDGCILDVSSQEFPISSTHQDDIETSVTARFQILKQRNDCSSSIDVGEHHPEDKLENKILDLNVEPVSQNHAGNSSEDKSTVKELHLFVKEDAMNMPHMADGTRNRPHAGWYDGSSSDWEHVLMEELAGQT